MKTLFAFGLAICFFQILSAQQAPIVLQSGETAQFFNSLTDAVAAASDGDAIYLPGGTFSLASLNKRLNIYGSGYSTDSSKVTGISSIVGDVSLAKGANGSLFSAIHFPNRLIIAQSMVDLYIQRCKILTITYSDAKNTLNNLDIQESVIYEIFAPFGQMKINNCVIEGRIHGLGGNVEFNNSVLLSNIGYSTAPIRGINTFNAYNSILFLKNYTFQNDMSSTTLVNNLLIGETDRFNLTIDLKKNQIKPASFGESVFEGYYRTTSACNCKDKGVYSGNGKFRATPPVHIVFKAVSTKTSNNFLPFKFTIKTDY